MNNGTIQICENKHDKLDELNSYDIESNDCDEENQCVFCLSSDAVLYKSKVCECNSIYFCKDCIIKYNNYSEQCPQCKSNLKLKIGKKKVCVLCNPVHICNNLNPLPHLKPITIILNILLCISVILVQILQNPLYQFIYIFIATFLYIHPNIEHIDETYLEEIVRLNLITSSVTIHPNPLYSPYSEFILCPYTTLMYPANKHKYYILAFDIIPCLLTIVNFATYVRVV